MKAYDEDAKYILFINKSNTILGCSTVNSLTIGFLGHISQQKVGRLLWGLGRRSVVVEARSSVLTGGACPVVEARLDSIRYGEARLKSTCNRSLEEIRLQ